MRFIWRMRSSPDHGQNAVAVMFTHAFTLKTPLVKVPVVTARTYRLISMAAVAMRSEVGALETAVNAAPVIAAKASVEPLSCECCSVTVYDVPVREKAWR